MKSKVVISILVLTISIVSAEQTVGLFINEPEAYPGYTLFSASGNRTTYLINNEGMVVKSWTTEYRTERAYISEDGYLWRGILLEDNHPIFGKPIGGMEKMDWDGNVLWHYIYSGDEYARHHDVKVLPNGNVLMVAYEVKDSLECIEAGRDPSLIKNAMLFPDYVVELEPVGDSGANVVWEWHFWDHLIQDFDATKDNYGVVADHPELTNINAGGARADYPHLNFVGYNEEFDQLILTCAGSSEFYVIDHSTTTEEAAGHTGGNSGKGGDVLYRWGNPEFYDQGDSTDRRLFSTHDANWVPADCPGAGNIIVFNNGKGRTDGNYSSAEEIVPPVDAEGNYSLTGSKFGPDEALWTYTRSDPEFYSDNGGGVQRLPNGNTLISNKVGGELFEVTPEKEMVWRYINPVSDSGPVHQGDSIKNNDCGGTRYPLDYPAFDGKDLTPQGPIELAGIVEAEPVSYLELDLYPGIFKQSVTVNYQLSRAGYVRIKLYNTLGQEVRTLVNETKPAGSFQAIWNADDNSGHKLSPGVYFCRLESGKASATRRIVLTE